MPTRLVVSFIVALVSLPALGQEPIPQPFLIELARDLAAIQQVEGLSENPTVRVTGADANVHAAAGLRAQVIGSLSAGSEARVINKSGDWYEVVMPDRRIGWVRTRDVEPSSEATEELFAFRGQVLAEKDDPTWFEGRVLTLLERAAAFKQAYSDNPYVTVAGFEISLSISGPALGMSFEFK
jgi:uncharacterized protein YgiM (DUF1202 family)